MRKEYVYILISPVLEPDMLKIGKTTKDPHERAKEISSATGVPFPYRCIYYVETFDCSELEKIIHLRLTDFRCSKNREFFKIAAMDAIKILEEEKENLNISNSIKYNLKSKIESQYFVDYKFAIENLINTESYDNLILFLEEIYLYAKIISKNKSLKFHVSHALLKLYFTAICLFVRLKREKLPLFEFFDLDFQSGPSFNEINSLILLIIKVLTKIFDFSPLQSEFKGLIVHKVIIDIFNEYDKNEVEQILFVLVQYLEAYIMHEDLCIDNRENEEQLETYEILYSLECLILEHTNENIGDRIVNFLASSFLYFLTLSGNNLADSDFIEYKYEENLDLLFVNGEGKKSKEIKEKINHYIYDIILLFIDFPDVANKLINKSFQIEGLLTVENYKEILGTIKVHKDLQFSCFYDREIILEIILFLKNDYSNSALSDLILNLIT